MSLSIKENPEENTLENNKYTYYDTLCKELHIKYLNT